MKTRLHDFNINLGKKKFPKSNKYIYLCICIDCVTFGDLQNISLKLQLQNIPRYNLHVPDVLSGI